MWKICCAVSAIARWAIPCSASGAICRASLAPGDRFVGGLRLVQTEGGDLAPVCRAIAAALRFEATDEARQPFAADVALHERIAREGAAALLCSLCGFDPVRDAAVVRAITA